MFESGEFFRIDFNPELVDDDDVEYGSVVDLTFFLIVPSSGVPVVEVLSGSRDLFVPAVWSFESSFFK